ncbi:MAG: zinc metallopeptidase [Bacteroidales bacterium]|uniref:zinc metallopeptidase n=1 Tax=Candidatus Cryptobacteroides sp. TaxID=2952915 RepID=UPI002A6FBC04|nr:zinc metallopeptidase [Candidatus Cryptobacteroides sp.]MBS7276965.1 zinc metallopeptidase [Bacteroidales bacterium]MCI6526183.1 zinc metallopeptidase [Bacteroidales bacterium]MDD6828308.1 zinc metallopeptidase [Bacteroidales bacterium]MDD7135646.1 zinc metallopeptidase [Bacteroidales bacterium]MDD7235454.1 zinc metallopeptidase [Bacteroidales bacterium]
MSTRTIWLLLIGAMILSLIIQQMLKSRFNRYSKVGINLSGAEIARKMLADNGIHDVEVTCVPGTLTDHYNPSTKTVNLSEAVYGQRNIAAAAVAAHECGHVIQHAKGYAPLKMRSALVPIVSFASNTVQWVLLLGVLLIAITPALLWAGIALFALTTLFSFITLPVEINASRRAVAWLENAGITTYETKPMASEALMWAAGTYVIAAISSLGTLLYYISIAMSRRD